MLFRATLRWRTGRDGIQAPPQAKVGETRARFARNSLKYTRKAEPLQGTNLVSLQFYQQAAASARRR